MTNKLNKLLASVALTGVAAGTLAFEQFDLQGLVLEKGEWIVELHLESTDGTLEDRYNRLGHYYDALPGLDPYDLPELDQTWPGTYLSVVFYRPEWEAIANTETDIFNTDFRPVSKAKADQWTFEVRSDDPARELTLSWAGSKRGRLRKMVLIDLEEGVIVPALDENKVANSYTFVMNGNVRAFAWRWLSRAERDSGTVDYPPSEAVEEIPGPVTTAGAVELKASKAGASALQAGPTNTSKSDWLPMGWEGGGVRRSYSVGLPEDPFGD
ncbi:MAG: hypothetical protein AAGA91_09710 [Pseudomonadota bacterium]